ncbi:hypothetical protein OE88DRAFT_1665186 [Heliocybe sulcata]|uniref:Rab-GAP TBC domain-containing protein n=1 Tax=Heliocybe sulcata TaxID=5364 RepID=A0A5C3MT50_9AGAM|nr:hypothetical protein OE88DRAFT_1665186 [Heliocybe sulcata]
MEPAELARWTRFAAKGGIGRCTALQDCVAESSEQLMFLKDDEITVLMQLVDQEGWYLGYCEGVVGRFQAKHVQVHGKLKKPVMTKRSSSVTPKAVSVSNSPSPTIRTLSPPDLESSSSSFGAALRPTSSQLSLVASSSYHHDSQMSEDDGPPAPSVSYSSSSTGPESILDTPLDSPDPTLEQRLSKSPLEGSDERAEAPQFSTTEEDRTPMREDLGEVHHVDKPPHSLAPPTPLSAHPSIADTRRSSIISLAMSDGETGIGLSLLQGMADGGDEDDDSSVASEESDETQLMHASPEAASEPEPPLMPPPPIAAESGTRSRTNSDAKSLGGSVYGDSRASLHSSSTGEWDGASDIYDDYRYSRYSMASKMSRFSRASMYTIASDAPPVPQELLANTQTTMPLNIRRRSLEEDAQAEAEAESVYSQQLSPIEPRTEDNQRTDDVQPSPQPVATEAAGESKQETEGSPPSLDLSRAVKDRPAPLNLAPSPLLHTTFGSPVSSRYPSGTSSLSPPLTAPPLPDLSGSKAGGAATVLRERFEKDRPSPSVSPPPQELDSAPQSPRSPMSPKSSVGIIVEDDDGIPDSSIRATFSAPPDTPSSASSYPDSPACATLDIENEKDDAPISPTLEASPPTIAQLAADGSAEPVLPRTQLATPDGGLQPRRRPSEPGRPPSQFIRTSIFMPHPNAPKAPAFAPAGPMYGRAPLPPQQTPTNNLVHTLRMAAASRYGPNGVMRRTTIYGMCQVDMSTSMGPVPIVFSLEPPQSVPANRLAGGAIRRPSTMEPNPPPINTMPVIDRSGSAPPTPVVPQDGPASSPQQPSPGAGNVIPRANFFPKAQTPRPRSRSFSGFDSPIAEIALPSKETSGDAEGKPRVLQSKVVSRTVSASAATPVAAQQATVSHHAGPVRRMTHGPSPLAMSSSSVPSSPTSPGFKSPASPSFKKGAQVFIPSPLAVPAPSSDSPPAAPRSLRQVASTGALGMKPPSSPFAASPPMQPMPVPVQSVPVQSVDADAEPPASPRKRSLDTSIPDTPGSTKADSSEPDPTRPSLTLTRTRSGGTDGSHYSETRSLTTSPPPGSNHRPSLRSKMSLASLQTRSTRATSPGPSTPLPGQETVQVKDMDFELVRPTMSAVASSRTSQDSLPSARESSVLLPDGQSVLRPYSPAMSSLSLPRSPNLPSDVSGFPTTPSDSAAPSIEAHRQRELKWISLMSATPASQARKSKKVKKLLLEGVPASVRSNVWQHLTDSKSKRMNGLYTQLGKRGKVPASADIERDASAFFPDKPQFQKPDGPVVYLLNAYLTMVPDIQYHPGLTLVAGQLLHQSIEEDAFWIFVSLMDSQLRPYFSSSTAQIEVDATLFGKALEANDAPLAKRLFGDMGVPPVAICRSWFCSIFAHALPPDTLHRVWDVFLYEGVVFLLRVGLAVAASCRKLIMESTKADAAVNILRNPPPNCLPANPEAFIAMALGMKLKDDDIRKQRNKMEAQVKKQAQRSASTPGTPQTSAISLPRAPADK